MKKFKDKIKYLESQSEYWEIMKGRSMNNTVFQEKCEKFAGIVDEELKYFNNLDNFIENGYRS